MPEEVLFKFEQSMPVNEIAEYLRTVATALEGTDPLTLESGNESVTMAVPDRPTFDIEAERETDSSGGHPELSVEFELEWDENADGDGSLEIE